ncbi:uncharacterized protein LOC115675234 [Syzygium oleosum]|uniref:uncharacterized protein LOC115675234 n=1 Tax=Syzygium oleosum TaxID=219896 RepID=UPI0011D225A9|nr:uncharacterized protein LOC115675234 [Syzygium oleosum]
MQDQQQQQQQQQHLHRSSCKRGLCLRSILLHSLWITVVGVFLFRLATANTQNVVYVQILAVSGVTLATVPWIIQLLVATVLILLYNAGGRDLLWIVESGLAEEKPCGEGPTKGRVLIRTCNCTERQSVHWPQRNTICDGSHMLVRVDGRVGPQLQRNRTV